MNNDILFCCIEKYFLNYLPNIKGCSVNTINTYRYAFTQFIFYLENQKKIKVNLIKYEHLNKENILEFLEYIEKNKKCSISTRNHRLSVIKSFLEYVNIIYPEMIKSNQTVLNIPLKKNSKPLVDYIEFDEVKKMLEIIDKDTPIGYRDYMIILLLFETGARVSELINIKVKDIRKENNSIIVTGKGNKQRLIPVVKETMKIVIKYIDTLNYNNRVNQYLFSNKFGDLLTRVSVNNIINKYYYKLEELSLIHSEKKISPHSFRHGKAMQLVRAGTNIIYVKDFLGHVDISTTEMYFTIDYEEKRKVIEKAHEEVPQPNNGTWNKDKSLLSFLKSLKCS